MAHELNYTDGKADMFSVRETPWHREGTLLDSSPSLEQALRVANLDYEVIKSPVFYDRQGVLEQSDKAFVTLRDDTGAELGAVGAGYTVVQNRAAFENTIGPLTEQGILNLETGGVLREGADAWLLGKLDVERFGPVVREVFTDEVIPYVMVAVNHSGRRTNTIALTPIRVVCANTLGMVEQSVDGGHNDRAIKVRHTGAAATRMVEAAERLLGGVIERYEVLATQYRALKETKLLDSYFDELVVLNAIGEHPTRSWQRECPDRTVPVYIVERYERKRDELHRMWIEGKGHKGDASAWEAYNGIVESLDHDTDLWPTRSGGRTQSLMSGALRDTKEAAYNALLRYAREGDKAMRGNALLVRAV